MTNTIQPARSVAKLRAIIVTCDEFIASSEEFLCDLRDTDIEDRDDHVIGFPQYGMYLGACNGLGNVLGATLFDAHAAVRHPVVRNLVGERAEVVSFAFAVTKLIGMQEDHVTTLWGMRRDLCDELEIAIQIEADEVEAAHLDMLADEAAFYDAQGVNEDRGITLPMRDADARQDR